MAASFSARPVTSDDLKTEDANRGIDPAEVMPAPKPGLAVVTGASTGIGQETVIALTAAGWDVVAVARRANRLAALQQEIGCKGFVADLSDPEHCAALAKFVKTQGRLTALVNNAGGAFGLDPVLSADPSDYLRMYNANVMTALNTTQAMTPLMGEQGGDIVFVTSIAALETYPKGAGYTGVKHAEAMLPRTMRQELVGQPYRVIEVCPGLVQTPEFTVNRIHDTQAAAQVYKQIQHPLAGADIARAIVWALGQPRNVNIDQIVIRPMEQATGKDFVSLKQPLIFD